MDTSIRSFTCCFAVAGLSLLKIPLPSLDAVAVLVGDAVFGHLVEATPPDFEVVITLDKLHLTLSLGGRHLSDFLRQLFPGHCLLLSLQNLQQPPHRDCGG